MSKKLRLKRSGASLNEINFAEIVTHKILEANSSFHVKYRTKEIV